MVDENFASFHKNLRYCHKYDSIGFSILSASECDPTAIHYTWTTFSKIAYLSMLFIFELVGTPGSAQSVEVSKIAITPPAVYLSIAAWNLSHQTS